jgi:hypothetical protein
VIGQKFLDQGAEFKVSAADNFTQIDTDGDGTLTQAEFFAHAALEFSKHSEEITGEEYKNAEFGAHGVKLFALSDENKDGSLDLEEYQVYFAPDHSTRAKVCTSFFCGYSAGLNRTPAANCTGISFGSHKNFHCFYGQG